MINRYDLSQTSFFGWIVAIMFSTIALIVVTSMVIGSLSMMKAWNRFNRIGFFISQVLLYCLGGLISLSIWGFMVEKNFDFLQIWQTKLYWGVPNPTIFEEVVLVLRLFLIIASIAYFFTVNIVAVGIFLNYFRNLVRRRS